MFGGGELVALVVFLIGVNLIVKAIDRHALAGHG
jgi:hypothetical protein